MSQKHDAGKPRFDLLPPRVLLEVVRVLTHGAESKYADNGWMEVVAAEGGKLRYLSAAERHINEYKLGEQIDEESGYHKLAHTICSTMFVLHEELRKDLGAQGVIPPPSSHLET